jgi:CHAT domain-containing protein/tetratricopeptide (TPR) repeat protein
MPAPSAATPPQDGDQKALDAAYLRGETLKKQGDYPAAVKECQTGVRLAEKIYGPKHLVTGIFLNNLGLLYLDLEQFDQAEPLLLRSLRIKDARPDRDRLGRAVTLNNLGLLYSKQNRFDRAESFYLRSLKIYEERRGKDHADLARTLNNLAGVYRVQGLYARAEPLYRRSLQIREARLGPEHPDVAQSLNNIALLYMNVGQFARAEMLLQRSLKIREAKLGKDHPDLIVTLSNLALVWRIQGRLAQAEPLYRRSLKIAETRLTQDHPLVALCLNNLAVLYDMQKQYGKAKPLLRRSLKIRRAKLGPDHPLVGNSLLNLALLYHNQDRLDEAERLYHKGLKVLEARAGPDHPEVATGLESLALLYAAREQWDQASRTFDRAQRKLRRHVSRVLPGLSEPEQLVFLRTRETDGLHVALSLGLARRTDAALCTRSAAWLLNGKAAAQQALAERSLLARDRADPKLTRTVEQLSAVRGELARLQFAGFTLARGTDLQERVARLTEEETNLSKKLGRAVGRPVCDDPWVEAAEVRKALPKDAVLVDIAQFSVWDFRQKMATKPWQPRRYAAWVIPPQNRDKIQLIDLGPADKIDAAVAQARRYLQEAPNNLPRKEARQAELQGARALKALAALVLRPLEKQLRPYRTWIISPDAALWLVPWAALPLPDGSHAIEKHTVSYVISGRDLVAPEVNPARLSKETPGRPLILADPDFDLEPGKSARDPEVLPFARGLLSTDQLPRFARLPGTAVEARAVAPFLQRHAGEKPAVHTGKKALESAFKAAKRPRIVVLSTHGFFLEDQDDAVVPFPGGSAGRGLHLVTRLRPRRRLEKVQVLENPLLRCGLALAGANHRDRVPAGADDGILTGLEIVGTDLRGCELVVLSACETGVGQVRNGEGVAGLRQAFQLAGAQAVVATLWQIPDKETAALTTAFFQNLAAKKGKAEALRRAQLKIIKDRRAKHKAAHPFYWAAFTLTGNGQ